MVTNTKTTHLLQTDIPDYREGINLYTCEAVGSFGCYSESFKLGYPTRTRSIITYHKHSPSI